MTLTMAFLRPETRSATFFARPRHTTIGLSIHSFVIGNSCLQTLPLPFFFVFLIGTIMQGDVITILRPSMHMVLHATEDILGVQKVLLTKHLSVFGQLPEKVGLLEGIG